MIAAFWEEICDNTIMGEDRPTCDLNACFQDLYELSKGNIDDEANASKVIKILDDISENKDNISKENIEVSMDDVFPPLLNQNSLSVATKASQTIAELAKNEKGREKCSTVSIVNKLINNMNTSNDIPLLTQTSRALGNISYYNQKGKDLIKEENGLKGILDLINKGLRLGEVEGADYLRDVSGGCLITFLTDQEHLLTQALEEGLMSIICNVLDNSTGRVHSAKIKALLMLGVLNDNNIQFLDANLTKILVNILMTDDSVEVLEMCLEVLRGQAENEQVKEDLVELNACEIILNILEKFENEAMDEEIRLIVKYGSDLIVCITTGDKSMERLYADGAGKDYLRLMGWLEKENEDLQTMAVLTAGNFARFDQHCERMVCQGIHLKLLSAVKKNNNQKSSIRLQHALLSALRNLVISKTNKNIILDSGLIQVLRPMVDIPTFPVVFKLLGTLRIVIDHQQEAAIELGKQKDLVRKAVSWANTKEHPGVEGEAKRLLSWLIINSKDKEVIQTLTEHNAIKHLVSMLTSEYLAMQNEALLSLILTCAMNLSSTTEEQLIESSIGEKLNIFLNNNIGKLEAPMIKNVLLLTETLIKSETMTDHLVKTSWPTSLLTQIKSSDEEIQSRIKKLEDFFRPICTLPKL